MQELKDRATLFREHQFIPALDHGINKSDTVVGSTLNTTLQKSLRRLEQVRRQDKIHRPQASQCSIVDPSLYPLHFGLTKYKSSPMSSFRDCIRLSGKGISRKRISPEENSKLNERNSYKIENAFSLRYQWLPCDINFEEGTDKVR